MQNKITHGCKDSGRGKHRGSEGSGGGERKRAQTHEKKHVSGSYREIN